MRTEKQILTKEYVARLNASPFFIVVDYRGLKVSHLTELRKPCSSGASNGEQLSRSALIGRKSMNAGDLCLRALSVT